MARRSSFISTSSAAPGPDYPLDDYPGSLFGCSLRRLSASYNGPCMLVFDDDGTNPETIGFDGDFIDTAALLAKAAAGNGFVRVSEWYTQNGGSAFFGRTNNSQRPFIVESNAIPTFDGVPGVQFRAGSRLLNSGSTELNTDRINAILAVGRPATTTEANHLQVAYTAQNTNRIRINTSGTNNSETEIRISGVDFPNSNSNSTFPDQVLVMGGFTASEVYTTVNGFRTSTAYSLGTFFGDCINLRTQTGENVESCLHEVLIYPTEQIGLYEQINSYYNFF